ncbi:MAG: macro domain-containing protein [Lachnospiraceae bacterium]|nr:macro domain-containing protein [Lachnospiraceae bacterium]
MPFRIIRNDITKVKADAIVNTANPKVCVGAGVDAAVYKAAGEKELFKEREKIGDIPLGEAAVTPAFNLDAEIIIHTAGTRWEGGDKDEVQVLKSCYVNSLKLAAEHNCKSVAFPLLATGAYGFPKRLGMKIAVDVFTAFLEEHDMEIILVVFDKESSLISGELARDVAAFIDDEYASWGLTKEYGSEGIPGKKRDSERGRKTPGAGDIHRRRPMSPALGKGISGANAFMASIGGGAAKLDATGCIKPVVSGNVKPEATSAEKADATGTVKSDAAETFKSDSAEVKNSLDDMLKSIYKDSFEKHLQKLINKKGLKNSEVYAAANISKQYFSKLLKGQVKPSKEKVLALAVGLRLNMDEAIDFLELAGYALSPISQTDAVVRYFIENKEYNVIQIDIVLFDYGLDPLSKG